MCDSGYFAINYECNNKCLFCPNRNEKFKGTISFNDFKNSLDAMLSNSNVKHITISGGEPTLNKDFIKIMKYATEQNITVGLFSNSNKFADKNFIEDFACNVKTDNIFITSAIHSFKSDIHDKTTQVVGSFGRTVQGLKNLMNKNYRVVVKNCINQLNYKHINEFVNFIIDEFPNVHNIGLYGLDYCGTNDEQNKKVMVKFSEISPYLETALENFESKKSNYHLTVYDLPFCIVKSKYWKYFISNRNRTNAARSAPETRRSEFGKVEFNIPNQCGTFSLKCRECAVEKQCPGTWKSSWELLGDEEIMPVHLSCSI